MLYQPYAPDRLFRREPRLKDDGPSPLLVAHTVWTAIRIGQDGIFPACILPARTAGLVLQALRAEGGGHG